MGDAAHMASPRTGAGAQVAMMDAIAFGDCMKKSISIDTALKIYNAGAIDRAKQLFNRSRQIAGDFAPQGYSKCVSPTQLI